MLETQFKGIIIFKVSFIGLLLFFGAYLVQTGALNVGQFLASEIIIFLVINSVEKLIGSLQHVLRHHYRALQDRERFLATPLKFHQQGTNPPDS